MTHFSPAKSFPNSDRFIVGPGRGQAVRRHRAAAIAGAAISARRCATGDAEEHPDDRADRVRQDRDLAPPRPAGEAPFLKVEATKFTEVGYVGPRRRADRPRPGGGSPSARCALDPGTTCGCGPRGGRGAGAGRPRRGGASEATAAGLPPQAAGRRDGRQGDRAGRRPAENGGGMPLFDIPGLGAGRGASVGLISLQETGQGRSGAQDAQDDGQGLPPRPHRRGERRACSTTTRWCARPLRPRREREGIVFLDEIDKICARSGRALADVSREGVQRDLLPLIEGTSVSTKHGPVNRPSLFIASGAFHFAKPSDLLPVAGRLADPGGAGGPHPRRPAPILTEPEATSSPVQGDDGDRGLTLDFTPDGIDALADVAAEVNASVENIGARRLQTVLGGCWRTSRSPPPTATAKP